jgi:hypothetical protein
MKYTPRPLRESNPRKSTAELQADIDLMRAIWLREGSNNHRRVTPEQWIGYGFIAGTVAIALILLVL